MLDVFGLFKVDTLYVVIGLLVITIVAIVLAIVAICKACAMMKKYDMMMEGSDGKSMEKMVRKYTDDIINLQKTSEDNTCLLYTSPSPRDPKTSRMPSSA